MTIERAPHRIEQRDCRDFMRALAPESVHAIVTDPPYGLDFMGAGWDAKVPGVEFWREAFRVLKPGGTTGAGGRGWARVLGLARSGGATVVMASGVSL